jgi:hypothetical protein
VCSLTFADVVYLGQVSGRGLVALHHTEPVDFLLGVPVFERTSVEGGRPIVGTTVPGGAAVPGEVGHRHDAHERVVLHDGGAGNVVFDEKLGDALDRPMGLDGLHVGGHQVLGRGVLHGDGTVG